MRLYEFEAKQLLKRFAIPIPEGTVVDSPESGNIDYVTYPAVVKAQVFLGGRGKAGLVQQVSHKKGLKEKVQSVLGKKHGAYTVTKVLIEKKVDIAAEIYVSATIDRLEHKPVLIVSREGGVDIEEIARKSPQSILKYYFNPGENLMEYKVRAIAGDLGLCGSELLEAARIILCLYRVFTHYDCKLVEVNPLVRTSDNRFYALDAKVDLDEDAMFRHPDLKLMGIQTRHEVGELTDREKVAKAHGIPYVDLEGDIGVFPGGAGFGIAAVDLITHYGGAPANFMDSGGAPTQDKLRAMLGLLIDNPDVKAIFGARFGGISRCDDWARAVVEYVKVNKPEKPMIMRMAGNMEEEGRKILEKAKHDEPELFKHIKIYAVDTPIEEVIKETIRVARKRR
jgi:succinyl-CoA synthetase beta subunit